MADKASAVQRIKELDEERNLLLSTAKKEGLDKAQAAIADLNALGFRYRLVEDGGKATAAPAATRKGTRTLKDAPCPICEFKTTPPHDARRHRSQGGRKKPFTAKQLEEHGLTKTA